MAGAGWRCRRLGVIVARCGAVVAHVCDKNNEKTKIKMRKEEEEEQEEMMRRDRRKRTRRRKMRKSKLRKSVKTQTKNAYE